MGNIVPRARPEPTSLALHGNVQTISPPSLPDVTPYSRPPVYAAPCRRDQSVQTTALTNAQVSGQWWVSKAGWRRWWLASIKPATRHRGEAGNQRSRNHSIRVQGSASRPGHVWGEVKPEPGQTQWGALSQDGNREKKLAEAIKKDLLVLKRHICKVLCAEPISLGRQAKPFSPLRH